MPQLASATLALLVTLFLSACGSGSSCGGGSGYQVDGVPGLLSCSSSGGTGTTSSAGSTTDVTNTSAVAQNTGFNSDVFATSIYYAMSNTTQTMPTAGTAATLTLSPTSAHPQSNPNDYTLTTTATGFNLYCEIAGGGVTYHDPTYSLIQNLSSTLRVNFPTFTGTGTFTIQCVGTSGGGNTTATTLQVIVP